MSASYNVILPLSALRWDLSTISWFAHPSLSSTFPSNCRKSKPVPASPSSPPSRDPNNFCRWTRNSHGHLELSVASHFNLPPHSHSGLPVLRHLHFAGEAWNCLETQTHTLHSHNTPTPLFFSPTPSAYHLHTPPIVPPSFYLASPPSFPNQFNHLHPFVVSIHHFQPLCDIHPSPPADSNDQSTPSDLDQSINCQLLPDSITSLYWLSLLHSFTLDIGSQPRALTVHFPPTEFLQQFFLLQILVSAFICHASFLA